MFSWVNTPEELETATATGSSKEKRNIVQVKSPTKFCGSRKKLRDESDKKESPSVPTTSNSISSDKIEINHSRQLSTSTLFAYPQDTNCELYLQDGRRSKNGEYQPIQPNDLWNDLLVRVFSAKIEETIESPTKESSSPRNRKHRSASLPPKLTDQHCSEDSKKLKRTSSLCVPILVEIINLILFEE